MAKPRAAAPSPDIKTPDEIWRIAVTVRLLPADYRRLMFFGIEHRETNQNIIVNALDAYLRNAAK